MARRSIAARAGVALASLVLLIVGAVVGLSVLAPSAAPPAAARGVTPPQESDHCYVEGMLAHHAQALELSERILDADGVSDRVRALAEFIIADQSAEMTTMTAWSTAWAESAQTPSTSAHADHSTSEGSHTGHSSAGVVPAASGCTRDIHATMSGMATPEQLAALAAADGAPAQRLFLELMIVHHEGALVMARDALVDGANAFVRTSAKHVIVEQQREITAMTSILRETP